MKMKTEAGGGPDIDDGTYLVRVTAITEVEIDTSKWDKGRGIIPGARFYFVLPDLPDEEGEPTKLDSRCTAERLTPSTKLWKWLEVLSDAPLEPGMDLDFDIYLGCEAMAAIVNEENQNKVMWPQIKALVALPAGMKTEAPPRAPAPTPAPLPESFQHSRTTPGPPVDPWQGFRSPEGKVDWNIFNNYLKKERLELGDLANYMGVGKADPASIRDWTEGGPGRTALQLILETIKALRPPLEERPEIDPNDPAFQ